MKFGFIAKHRRIWPVAWLCAALGVSRSGPCLARASAERAIARRRGHRREGAGELPCLRTDLRRPSVFSYHSFLL